MSETNPDNQSSQTKSVSEHQQQRIANQQAPKTQDKEQPTDQHKQEQIQKQMKMHQQQQKMIREQIQAESPLIGEKFPLALLMDEFVNNEGFYIKIQNLMSIYDQYRKTRRDGSCFYRALNFCIFQKIVCGGDKKLQSHMLEKIKNAKQHLLKANFQGLIFQDLQEIFIQKLDSKLPKDLQELLKMFRDSEESNILVLMLRFITSGEIKNNAALYETFIDDQIPVQMFCQIEVEPIDKQADQIPIMALLNYLQVGIRIVYLDSSKNKEPYKVILPQSFNEKDIVGQLLYRPGHYDILYK